MRIKTIAASVLTVASLALATVGTVTPALAATAAVAESNGVVYVHNNTAALYNGIASGTATAANRLLGSNTAWRYNKIATIDGVNYYQVSTDAWVRADEVSTNAPVESVSQMMYVSANGGGVNLYSSANNGYFLGKTVKDGAGYQVYSKTTDNSGQVWYDLGKDQWINGKYLTTVKPVQAITMSATAYDPAVLGSSMGYSGVAANLSRYPKGTRLRITTSNGTVMERTVNDTGYFALSNPNQLDIAMPNSQALQFGRQSVSVQVIN